MTLDEIIARSDEALPSDIRDKAEQLLMVGGAVALWRLAFISGYQKGVAAEREACAKVADDFSEVTARIDGGLAKSTAAAGMRNIAEAIRNRTATDKGE